MNNLIPLPNYSLYDLFVDLMAGRKTTFMYNEVEFTVKRKGWTTIVSNGVLDAHLEDKATCMLDLQGMAATILHQNKDRLVLNSQGEVIN